MHQPTWTLVVNCENADEAKDLDPEERNGITLLSPKGEVIDLLQDREIRVAWDDEDLGWEQTLHFILNRAGALHRLSLVSCMFVEYDRCGSTCGSR